jgi:hypothetical protein
MDEFARNPVAQIARLKELALWYRAWADKADNAMDRQERLRRAADLDADARALTEQIRKGSK